MLPLFPRVEQSFIANDTMGKVQLPRYRRRGGPFRGSWRALGYRPLIALTIVDWL